MRVDDAPQHLAGFFRLRVVGEPASVMLSCGLAPELCGRGLGRVLVRQAVETSHARHAELPIALLVREFNVRAILLYERAGFCLAGRDEPTGMLRMEHRQAGSAVPEIR